MAGESNQKNPCMCVYVRFCTVGWFPLECFGADRTHQKTPKRRGEAVNEWVISTGVKIANPSRAPVPGWEGNETDGNLEVLLGGQHSIGCSVVDVGGLWAFFRKA